MSARHIVSGAPNNNLEVFWSILSADAELMAAVLSDDQVSYAAKAAAVDKPKQDGLTDPMNEPNRENISSAISSAEERMDKRIQKMGDELQREMRLRERSARREAIAHSAALKAHVESNDRAVASTLAALERTEREFGTVKQANKEQRYWMAGIGVAIVLGIMGANATIFGGGKAFFDGGKDSVVNQQRVEQLIQEAKTQSDANAALLKQIQSRQEASVAPK